MLLWKHFLGFLTAKASVYEPFYTLEVSCLAGCDSDLINATQAEAKWVLLDFSRGSSLVLNPFRAIHGIETQNSTLDDPAISSDTIRHHELSHDCAGALGLSMWHIRIWCCQQGGGEAALPRWPSFTAWKESENIVKLPSEQNWSFIFWQNYRAWPFWFKALYIFIYCSGGIPLRVLLWFHLEVGPHSWMYRPYDQAGHFVSKGSQVTRSRGIVKIVYV